MKKLFVVGLVALVGGCFIHGKAEDDQCFDVAPAPESLVDPANLMCESFSTGPSCPCGVACPAIAQPIPTWGSCDSSCRAMDEATCAATAGCRIARDWSAYYDVATTPDFLGCYPTDTTRSTALCDGLDAQVCSEQDACTALYEKQPNGTTTFQQCINEGQIAGTCYGQTLCDRAQPACPSGTTVGIANGCYTNACIPDQFCVAPPPT